MKTLLNKFIPDFFFNDIYAFGADFLLEHGVKGIILDIDDTLVPHGSPSPSGRVTAFIAGLRENGVRVCLISNSGESRVGLFNKSLSLPVYPKAGKPSVRALLHAARDMGLPAGSVAIAGDQIFTDVFAGKRAGMTAILVKPIEPFENPFFLLKRLCEKPFIRHYNKHRETF